VRGAAFWGVFARKGNEKDEGRMREGIGPGLV